MTARWRSGWVRVRARVRVRVRVRARIRVALLRTSDSAMAKRVAAAGPALEEAETALRSIQAKDIGLLKNLALSTHVTTDDDEEPIKQL